MSYFENVYKSRVNFHGMTKKEIITEEATRQFLENVAESPNSEAVTVDKLSTRAIILTNKADQSKLSMYIHTQKSVEVDPGSIVVWNGEEWLIMSSDKYSMPAYNKSIMFESNVRVKFYDDYGALYDLPGVFLGSLDGILREAVYRQMGMAVQLDDRRAMLIVPHKTLKVNTRLLLDGRAWRVVDYDSTSNKDLVYLSLQEDNIDASRDDVALGIADAFVKANWEVYLPTNAIELLVDGSYKIEPVIFKDGVAQTGVEWVILGADSEYISIAGDTVIGVANGISVISVALKESTGIAADLTVSVVENAAPIVVYELVGDSILRLGESKTYQLQKVTEAGGTPISAVWALTAEDGTPTILATLKRVNTVTYSVTANEDMHLGKVKLSATAENETRTKVIEIRSLW